MVCERDAPAEKTPVALSTFSVNPVLVDHVIVPLWLEGSGKDSVILKQHTLVSVRLLNSF